MSPAEWTIAIANLVPIVERLLITVWNLITTHHP